MQQEPRCNLRQSCFLHTYRNYSTVINWGMTVYPYLSLGKLNVHLIFDLVTIVIVSQFWSGKPKEWDKKAVIFFRYKIYFLKIISNYTFSH